MLRHRGTAVLVSRLPLSRTPLVVGTVVVAIVGGGLLVSRWLDHDARALASRLLQCPYEQVEVQSVESGDVERWRVEGCGTRGTMMCEPTDAGCIVVPDE